MKLNLNIFIIILLLNIHFALFAQTTQFIPLKVGNYWVYSNSDHPNKLDTVKVSDKEIVGSDTAYHYNGNLWMERNDTAFTFQSQRNGSSFPCIEYFPSDKSITYNIMIGGDVLGYRSVRKIEGEYKSSGVKYSNCYEYKQMHEDGYGYVIISAGIGIIESHNAKQIVTLVGYHIK